MQKVQTPNGRCSLSLSLAHLLLAFAEAGVEGSERCGGWRRSEGGRKVVGRRGRREGGGPAHAHITEAPLTHEA